MAEWVPPKIDYWDTPRPVGGEDFKRIEGNIDELATHRLMGKKIVLIASGTATITDSDLLPKEIILNNARNGDFLIASTRFDWEIHYGRPFTSPLQSVYYLRLRLPSNLSQMTASYQVIALRDV